MSIIVEYINVSSYNVICQIQFNLKKNLEDGRGLGWGDHFLPHKFTERTFER